MSDMRITHYKTLLSDGADKMKSADGKITSERSQTDLHRLRALTDADINAAMANDDDWLDEDGKPLELDWSKAKIIAPEKKAAISIRVDEDILDFFKSGGPGYQRRIHAVLRSYVDQLGSKPKQLPGEPKSRASRK